MAIPINTATHQAKPVISSDNSYLKMSRRTNQSGARPIHAGRDEDRRRGGRSTSGSGYQHDVVRFPMIFLHCRQAHRYLIVRDNTGPK